MRRIFCFLFIFNVLIGNSLYAQDSCHYQISIITLSPGDESYTVFGHSAIRVVDTVHQEDVVYNYGTFDFDEPGFITKFINGKLLYYISTADFGPFVQEYRSEKRVITEQILNLTCTEKQNIVSFLYNNLQGNNKFYKYDFLEDNCTTRLRDLLIKNVSGKIDFARVVKPNATFRDLLHSDLNYHDHQWIKLGIDLLLGSKTDRKMSTEESMYLPDYLMTTLGSSKYGDRSMVLKKLNLSKEIAPPVEKNFLLSPLFFFSLFSLVIIFLSFQKGDKYAGFLRSFDAIYYCIIGAAGIIFTYLWLVSDQSNYKNNYNLIWALPIHFLFSFFSYKKTEWVNHYFKFTLVISLLLLFFWPIIPQNLNPALIPLLILLAFRSWRRIIEFKTYDN